MQPPSRCRIPKTAPRAALHRTRGSYWENSAPSKSFRKCLRCEIAQPRPPSAARSLVIRSVVPNILLYARAMAATLKQTAAANARLNRVVHMSRSYDCRRERGLSATGACLVHVLWPMMVRRCALSARLSRGVQPFSRSLRAVEPHARTAYSLDIRAWPCFVAHLAVCLPIGNADFG